MVEHYDFHKAKILLFVDTTVSFFMWLTLSKHTVL